MDNSAAPAPGPKKTPPLDVFHYLRRLAGKQRILRGTRQISSYIFGSDDKASVRSMFHILETSTTIPAFKIGGMWCVSVASLNAKIWEKESRAWTTDRQEALVRLHIVLSMLMPLLIEPDIEDGGADSTRSAGELVAEAIVTIDRLLNGSRS